MARRKSATLDSTTPATTTPRTRRKKVAPTATPVPTVQPPATDEALNKALDAILGVVAPDATRPELADEFDLFTDDNNSGVTVTPTAPVVNPTDELERLRQQNAELLDYIREQRANEAQFKALHAPEQVEDPTDHDEDEICNDLVLPTEEEISAYLTDTDKYGSRCKLITDSQGTKRRAYASKDQNFKGFLNDYRPVKSGDFKLDSLLMFHPEGPQFKDNDPRKFALVIFVKKDNFKTSAILCMQDCGPLVAGYLYLPA